MNQRPNPFPDPLHYDNAGWVDGRRLIELTAPFRVVTSLGCFEVPDGFVCDGASIPKLAQAIIGHPFAEYQEDAVAHDWLYSKKSDHLGFSRQQSDLILRETMWNRRISLWKIAAFHAAVRAGGWQHYKRR